MRKSCKIILVAKIFVRCFVMQDSKVRVFQYELINNVSYLNKMLFKIIKSGSFDVLFVIKRVKPRTSHFTNGVEQIMESATFFFS